MNIDEDLEAMDYDEEGFENYDDEDNLDLDDEPTGLPQGVKFALIVVAAVLVVGGAFLVGRMTSDPGVSQDQIDGMTQSAYDDGYNTARDEFAEEASGAAGDVADLRSALQDRANETNALQSRIGELEQEKQDILQDAQNTINDVAEERDRYRDQLEDR